MLPRTPLFDLWTVRAPRRRTDTRINFRQTRARFTWQTKRPIKAHKNRANKCLLPGYLKTFNGDFSRVLPRFLLAPPSPSRWRRPTRFSAPSPASPRPLRSVSPDAPFSPGYCVVFIPHFPRVMSKPTPFDRVRAEFRPCYHTLLPPSHHRNVTRTSFTVF